MNIFKKMLEEMPPKKLEVIPDNPKDQEIASQISSVLNFCRIMEWVSVKDSLPLDDQTVFVINNKVQMLPIKAYYCEEWNEFMSLENGDGTNHPLSITHWMPLPQSPKQ